MPISLGAPAKGPKVGFANKRLDTQMLAGGVWLLGFSCPKNLLLFRGLLISFSRAPSRKNKDHSRLRNFDPKKMVVLR